MKPTVALPRTSEGEANFRMKPVAPLPRTDVPCGTCRLCCKVHFVFLNEHEYDQYDWGWCMRTGQDGKQYAVGRVLNRKPNGDCIYLDDNGCTIHDRAPKVCREFDCRTLFLRSDRNGRRLAIKNGEVKHEIFEQGRLKLKETEAMAEFKPMDMKHGQGRDLLVENQRLRKLLDEAMSVIKKSGDTQSLARLQIMFEAIHADGSN